ncbi:oxygenase MpaB family protein [Gordonia sp. CPCC 205333]|uniref:oxygenase MpaB family protein n=1 Tax=Gordonia sp. CPCC 205333 TaxID=3140790 RepID=UPI003AF3F2AC
MVVNSLARTVTTTVAAPGRIIAKRKAAKRNPSLGLDPETDYAQIYRNVTLYEFPWDMNQALSFALFRTYAVPSIGDLLDRTGQFCDFTQKRYDDTSLLLEAPLVDGFDSPTGKTAVRRINQMHKMYDISNEDMLYVLSTFVVVPKRWLDDYGWRALTESEVRASVRYYQDLGKHMAIKDVPASYDDFATLMDSYEQSHFAYNDGARRVADSTLHLMTTFYPRPARRGVELFSRALMDEPLLNAFGYRDPGATIRTLSVNALRLRARLLSVLPSRTEPMHIHDMPNIKSYPSGYDLAEMGTFPTGCPVPHTAPNSAGQAAG